MGDYNARSNATDDDRLFNTATAHVITSPLVSACIGKRSVFLAGLAEDNNL